MVFAPLFPVLWLLWRSVLIVKLMLAIYGYVAVLIDAYLLATVINALPLTIKPTKILILGAGLIKGGVGPVLRRRLLGGLALYQRFPKAELIMSGGQGTTNPNPRRSRCTGLPAKGGSRVCHPLGNQLYQYSNQFVRGQTLH